jgi:Domain of unknown function (DUF4440)
MVRTVALLTFAGAILWSVSPSSPPQKIDEPLAKQMSVNGTTIRYWEQGKGVPVVLNKPSYKILAETAHRCIPGSQLITIPVARHDGPKQNSSAFNQALLAFLARTNVRSLPVDVIQDEAVDELQGQPRQLPPATDIDPKLTEEFRQLEQQLCDAILHKDARILDRLLGPEFTLRVADIPQSSLPRAIWIDNTLNRLKPESCEQHHHAARKLADDLAVVSLLWTQKGTNDGRDFSGDFYVVDFWRKRRGDWQIIARYSSPVGKPPDRPLRQLPPPTDSDP